MPLSRWVINPTRIRLRAASRWGAIVAMIVFCGHLTAQGTTVRLNEERFGAIADDGKDDGAALKRALTELIENGGGTLEIPSGTYHIDQPAILEGSFEKVRIAGMGHGLSRLICRNKVGLIKITATNPDAVVEVVDVDLPPGVPAAGTCLEFIKPSSGPDDIPYNLLLSNLELRPEDLNTSYYLRVFEIDGWKALIDNINTSGLYGPKFTSFEDKRKKYLAKSIIRMRNAYQPRVQFSNFWAAEDGINIELTDAHVEPTINAAVSVENAHGIQITKVGDKPLTNPVWIDGCHWNNAFTGLTLTGIDGFRIVQNCLYGASDVEETYNDMRFIDSSNGDIVDNSFWFGVKSRVNIFIDKNSSDIVIRNTHFGQNVSTEPVVIEDGAKNITVKDNSYGTVYALDENQTFGLWEFEELEEERALDKDRLAAERNNDLLLTDTEIQEGSHSLKLGKALYFNAPSATARSKKMWSASADSLRIHLHLLIGQGLEATQTGILEIPGVAELFLENGSLKFTFIDKSGKLNSLEVPHVATKKDWLAVLAEVDPELGRAVLEVGGIGADRLLDENLTMKSAEAPLVLAPAPKAGSQNPRKFSGAMDQIWVQGSTSSTRPNP